MRKAKIVGVALVAMLAFTALTAAAASAHTWEFNKVALTSPKAYEGIASFEIEQVIPAVKARCQMRQKGKLGAGAIGVIESVTSMAREKTITCQNTDTEACPGTVTIEATNLPWNTELSTIDGELRYVLKAGGGSSSYQWTVKCKSSRESNENRCSAATNTLIHNNVNGSVESIFDKNSPADNCTADPLHFKGTEDLTLTTVEGILSAS
jgi:hypothetical protein